MRRPHRRSLLPALAPALMLCACGAADPDAPGSDVSEPAIEAQMPASLSGTGHAHVRPRTGVNGPVVDALVWMRSGESGMTCAELAACCPKLPPKTRPSCEQIVALADESLCSVIASPYCHP